MKKLPARRGLFPELGTWVDNFFGDEDRFWNKWSTGVTIPAVNSLEKDDRYILEFGVPGMRKEDFEISVDNGMLVVSAEREEKSESEEDSYMFKEFNYSKFRRSFMLPENVKLDEVKANYEDGLLRITLPKVKVEAKASAKMIDVV